MSNPLIDKIKNFAKNKDLANFEESVSIAESLKTVADNFGKMDIEKVRGPKGEKGDKGDKGDTGPQGKQGAQGIKGEVGPVGPRGFQGEQGIQGETGLQGPQGQRGEKGDKGEPGQDGSADTGEEIVEKINDLSIKPDLQIDASHIKNLPKQSIISNSNKYLANLLDVDLSDLDYINGKYILGSGSGGGTPGGSNTQIQFNDSGSFGGDADFTWDKTTNALSIAGKATIAPTDTDATALTITVPGVSGGGSLGRGIHFNPGVDAIEQGLSMIEITRLDDHILVFIEADGNAYFEVDAAAATGPGFQVVDKNGYTIMQLNNGTASFQPNTAGEFYIRTDAGDTFRHFADDGTTVFGGTVKLKDQSSAISAIFDTSDLVSTDKTFTFPDVSGTLAVIDTGGGTSLNSGDLLFAPINGFSARTISVSNQTNVDIDGTEFAFVGSKGLGDANGGAFRVTAGDSGDGAGDGGDVDFVAGNAISNGAGGDIHFTSGDSAGTNKRGGDIILQTGTSNDTGRGGDLSLLGGLGNDASGGSIYGYAGDANGTNADGGYVEFQAGLGAGGGEDGEFRFLPLGGSTVAGILDFNSLATTDKTFTFPNASGTIALTSNKLSAFAATTSAELAGVISDETGTGALVFANSPVFTTPNIGSATGSVSGNAGTATALQNARTIGGVSFNGTSNITVASATGGFAVSGGNLTLSAPAFGGMTITGAAWPGISMYSSSATEGTYIDFYTASAVKAGGFVLGDTSNTPGVTFKSYNSGFDIAFIYEPSFPGTNLMIIDVDAGNIGFGIGNNAPSARLHAISTTEQLRLGYDTSNYFKTTVGSSGGVTFDAVGSGAGFTFSDDITIADAKNIILNTSTGTKIGTATTQKLGFFNAAPVTQPTVTGSRGGNAALASLLTQLASLGLIVDSSSA